MPGDYSDDAAEALAMFCGRFLEILLYARTIQMCRASIAEAVRFPEGSARYFDVVLALPHERLAVYLEKTFGLPPQDSARAAQLLFGRIVHPRFPRALFGLDALSDWLDDEEIRPDFDLEPVHVAVKEFIASLKGR